MADDLYLTGVLSAADSGPVFLASAGESTRSLLKAYRVDISYDVAVTDPGPYLFYLGLDGGGNIDPLLVTVSYLPATGGTGVGCFSTGWVDFGDGMLFGEQNDTMEFTLESAGVVSPELTAGLVTVVVRVAQIEAGHHAPFLDGATPLDLPIDGGTTVTIDGNYFDYFTELTVGGVPVTPSFWDDETIIFSSPAHALSGPTAADTTPYTVTTANGGTSTGEEGFFFYDPDLRPEITSLDVDELPVGSTDMVTATGINFDVQGGLTGIGFFSSDPGSSIFPPAWASPDWVGYYAVTDETATEFTFGIGALPSGSYWVVPGVAEGLHWIGLATPFTVTP